MSGGVDFLERLDGDVGVGLGGGEVAVAEEHLDVSDVSSSLEHECGAGVAEDVAGAIEACCLKVAAGYLAHAFSADPVAKPADEDSWLVELSEQVVADIIHVLAEPTKRSFADGDEPVFSTLSFDNEDRPTVAIDMAKLDVSQFTGTHGCGVQSLENGAVSKTDGGLHIGFVEHRFNLACAQNVPREAMAELRQLELAGGVVEDEVFLGQPLEERSQRRQTGVLGGKRQGFSVSLAVVVQAAAIPVEDRSSNLRRVVEPSVVAPVNERAEDVTTVLDGG